ncbi:MAG: hypothetical protein QOI07_494 [Verrucomicrobiota bacterium]|jgi:hypothetical protein
MPRKKLPRALPPLPSRLGLRGAVHKTERLTEILRTVALENQREQPRAFYALRQVADWFRLPLATVSRAYSHLEKEGLLTRVRGSKTLLQGLNFDRQLKVRAFVGFPASLSAFVTTQAYRMFFIKIRRELRLRGFATAMVFYEKDEVRSPVLSERLRSSEVDTVLWFQPPRDAAKTTQWLGDFGIRVIGIAHDEFSSIPCRYEVRRDRAIAQLLEKWKSAVAIDHVIIPQSQDTPSSVVGEALRAALDDLKIRKSVAMFHGQRIEKFLRSLQKSTAGGIIFSSAALAAKFCFRAPEAVADLLRSQRVAFLNGPVSMPFAEVPNIHVDLVVVDWQQVAEQIVEDLIDQTAFQDAGPTYFQAEAKLRVPLSAFVQSI